MSVTISGTTGVSKVQANTVDTTELVDDAVNAAKLDSTASPEFAGVYLGGTGAANYLDDYEEGTWTPTLSPASGSITVNTGGSFCSYTKQGRKVTLQAFILVSSVSAPSGRLTLGGLPFVKGTSLGETVTNIYGNTTNSFTGVLILRIPFIDRQTDNGVDPAIDAGSVIKASTELSFTFSYFV